MTVKELIAELSMLDPDYPVTVYEGEGDFWDDIHSVVVDHTKRRSEARIIGQYGVQIGS